MGKPKIKRDKQVKPKFPIEYRMLVIPKLNEIEGKVITVFAMRTVTEFTSFRYEIIVEPEISNHQLRFAINGLRAPQTSIPNIGPAMFKIEYENLHGIYDVVISKHGKKDNIFSVKISDNKISIERSPKNKFIELVTDEAEW